MPGSWVTLLWPGLVAVWVSCSCCNNYHRSSGLKQHKFGGLLSWRPEVWKWSHCAEIKGQVGLCSFLEALEENLFSCLFQLLETTCIPWPYSPSSIVRARNGWLSLALHYYDTHSSTSLFHLIRTFVITSALLYVTLILAHLNLVLLSSVSLLNTLLTLL